MKINGVNHAKIHQLADWLHAELSRQSGDGVALPYGLCHSMAAGMVERLIDFTHHSAPRGDIGRIPNRVIARTMGWEGDADRFIAELVVIRWLDLDDVHRLLVHDWSHHAMEATKVSLIRRGETTFADGKPIREPREGDGEDQPKRPSRDRVATPSQQSERSSASASASASASEEPEEDSSAVAAAPPLVLAAPDPAPSKPKRERPEPTAEARTLAEDFRAAMARAHPGWQPPTPSAFTGWARDCESLLRKRPADEIREVMQWLFESDSRDAEFWRPNVMCPKKLAQQYDRLVAQRRRVTPLRAVPARGSRPQISNSAWNAYPRTETA